MQSYNSLINPINLMFDIVDGQYLFPYKRLGNNCVDSIFK